MASAAVRDRRSRVALDVKLLAAGLFVSLLAAGAVPANEPTKPTNPSPSTAPKPVGEPLKIDTGLVQGVASSDSGDVIVFRGIPYAAPPVGELRWRPPQPAKAWEGVRECAK
ncbi:MAG TPA: carboxylesterase family protein, partial [Planctomycetaceae bacterium]|nr:carboxylesterase family protein [Planctomycetaceae bacterium]